MINNKNYFSKGTTLLETIIAITCGSLLILAILPWIPQLNRQLTKAETIQNAQQASLQDLC